MNPDSELDIYDDDYSYFYVGEEGEFVSSGSVCDSELSLTDGESDCSDDGSHWTDTEDDDGREDGEADGDSYGYWTREDDSTQRSSMTDDEEIDSIGSVSFYIGKQGALCLSERTRDDAISETYSEAAADCDDDWFLDCKGTNECKHEVMGLHWLLESKHATPRPNKSAATLSVGACHAPPSRCQSFDESMATGLTVPFSDPAISKDIAFWAEVECAPLTRAKIQDRDHGICGTVNKAEHDEISRCDNVSLGQRQAHGSADESMRDGSSTRSNQDIAEPVASNERDEHFCASKRGVTSFRNALEEVLSHPMRLTALLTVPSWPVMDLMDAIEVC